MRESIRFENLEEKIINLHCRLEIVCMSHWKCIKTSSSWKMQGNISSIYLNLAKSLLTTRCFKSVIMMIQPSNVELRTSIHRLSRMRETQGTNHHHYLQYCPLYHLIIFNYRIESWNPWNYQEFGKTIRKVYLESSAQMISNKKKEINHSRKLSFLQMLFLTKYLITRVNCSKNYPLDVNQLLNSNRKSFINKENITNHNKLQVRKNRIIILWNIISLNNWDNMKVNEN